MADLRVTSVTAEERTIPEAAVADFRSGLRGELLLPGDSSYEEARRVHNGLIDRRPALILRCTGAADVMDAVNFARTNGILVAVRGGGHNVAGSGVCDGGILIDLSAMRGVHVDPRARTARAQGGATFGDVIREAQALGLAIPGGGASTTGVGGATLGGGMGLLQRKYGLCCDSLKSATVVTADGRFLTASQEENADLFWGLRGGGGNFGVVTSLEYRLHPVGPTVMLASPMYPADRAGEVLRAWRDFAATAPDEITSVALINNVPDLSALPTEVRGKPAVTIAACYSGPPEEGERAVQPLRELGTPLADFTAPVPYMVTVTGADPAFPKGDLYYWKSLYLDGLTDEVIDILVSRGVDRPSVRSQVELWHMGGAIARVGGHDMAFGWRDVAFMLNVASVWDRPQDSERNIKWTRDLWGEMGRFSRGGLYVNFPGFGEEGEELVRSAYGVNYQRLVEVKRKYDPTNLFSVNMNIAPKG